MVAFQWAIACNIWTHGWKVMGFWRLQPKFGHALSHCECRKICPNLPKSTQRWTLKFHQKSRFQCFSKIKISMCRGGRRACFHRLDFQSKNFSYAIFIVKKRPCMWISAYPYVENNFFGNLPHLWWIWDFAHMYLTQLQTRMWGLASHTDAKKWFFWPPKHCCPSRAQWKKTFSSTLNVMISQMVRNECVRFGRQVDIQVSYKILRLEILKDNPILDTSSSFQ
jgi:hypothetical protein